ncbi:MAG: hypothetical protein M1826_004847 [Phylliscum demangeonii]|nr:MAG: hypothetical protein M1826_004847 [Phylliscum demangeonii]
MALRNTAATMIFLQKSTTIPVPEIYAFDHTVDNEIGVPYIMMSFLEGRPVSELWFDRSGPTPVDARRERILDTIALSMEQLGRFTFNGIGTLQFAEPMAGPLADVGPLYTIDPGADLALDSISGAWQAGPFEDSKSCFKALLNRRQGSWPPCGFSELLRLMIDSIPPSRISPMSHSRESFVLSHPDYDSQNFLAREDGTLTGILDWDNVHTLPRCIGYDRFPGWLTRDWDPIRYGFGCENSREEDSPDTLERWRAYWTSKFTDSSWTKTSHVYEAIWIAATDQVCWAQIMDQIANILLCGSEKAEELPSRPEVLYDLEKGVLSVQGKKELLRRIRVLMGLSSTAASEASRET